MTNYFKTISFAKETKVIIGNVTYVINSYFDETSEALNKKMKRLLISEVQNYDISKTDKT